MTNYKMIWKQGPRANPVTWLDGISKSRQNIGIGGVSAEIRKERLPNTDSEHHRNANPVVVTHFPSVMMTMVLQVGK
jgi:hypothetical protein